MKCATAANSTVEYEVHVSQNSTELPKNGMFKRGLFTASTVPRSLHKSVGPWPPLRPGVLANGMKAADGDVMAPGDSPP